MNTTTNAIALPIPPESYSANPHRNMVAWCPSWRGGELPRWAKNILTLRWRLRHPFEGSARDCYPYQSMRHPLWDHWGTIKLDWLTFLCTQPYGANPDALAAFLADGYVRLAFPPQPGAWAKGTILYTFRPAFDQEMGVYPASYNPNSFQP